MNQPSFDTLQETDRLYEKLKHTGWTRDDCELITPLTLEINRLKKEKNAIILAHSYMTPDIMYGIADFIGDSYKLSKEAMETDAEIIIFCSVHFMAETAKILNPEKTVVVPKIAGCSLADSITPEDVRDLRKKYPEAGVVCYVNTTAAVKAQCDVCCTSSNALKIIEALPQKEVIYLPDEFMAKNLQPLTKKKIIGWKGKCIVHKKFSPKTIEIIRKNTPGVKILAHPECPPSVIDKVDISTGTDGMSQYINKSKAKNFMLATECGLSDRMKIEHPEKNFIGTCVLCPYMKEIMMKDIITALKNPQKKQIIDIPEKILKKAKKALDKMVKITEKILE